MVLPIGLLDISTGTLVMLGALAVLLFGERLPEVARTFGKKFNEFRKSVQSIQDEIRSVAHSATSELTSAFDASTSSSDSSSSSTPSGSNGSGTKRRSRASDEDYEEATAPKFVPPQAATTAESSGTTPTDA